LGICKEHNCCILVDSISSADADHDARLLAK